MLLVIVSGPALTSPAQVLSVISSNISGYVLFAVLVTAWMVFGIPFAVGVGALLKSKDSNIALAATLLSAGGILILGWGIYSVETALVSIAQAASFAPSPAEAAYQAAIWIPLTYTWTDPGIMTWGLGQFLFGWLAWKSRVLPNWLAILGIIGGIAGLLTHAVYQSPILFLILAVSATVWAMTTGLVLFRGR
jgi:hypothetical protein